MRKRRERPVFITAAEWRRRHLPGNPSKISYDPEMRRFVTKALRTMTFHAIAEACRDKFGAARAPRKSAVHRFWQKMQKPNRRLPR